MGAKFVADHFGPILGSGEGGGSGTITEIESTDSSITVTNPTGPIVNLEVSGAVTSVTANDTSVVISPTTGAVLVNTNTLDVIATDHPPAANWSNNSHKITSLADGSNPHDAVAYDQISGLVTGVSSVTAGDASVTISPTTGAVVVETADIAEIAAFHATSGAVNINNHKLTFVANGTVSTDGAAFGQIPVPSTTPTASTIPEWDANKNLSANSFLEGYTTTVTSGSTVTLLVGSTEQQFFTGSTAQTVLLPVTSTLVLGQKYIIVNISTAAVTVQSSGANNVIIVAAGTWAILTCILISGTTAASWDARYMGDLVATGKVLTVSNSLTLVGTDATTMTFPTTSATIARTDAAQNFTGTQTMVTGLAMNANKITGLANGSASTDAAAYGQIVPIADYTTAGDLLQATGASAVARLGIGTAGQLLQVNAGATAAQWATVTATVTAAAIEATFTTAGQIYLGTGSGTGEQLALGTANQFLQVNSGGTQAAWHTLAAADIEATFGAANQIYLGTGSGTGTLFTLTPTPTATTFAAWDANKNLSANSFIDGYTTTATAAGTTTLAVGSTGQQFFTGTTTQTVVLPVVSTLVLGQQYIITNLSTGAVTVESSGANSIVVLAGGTTGIFTVILVTGTGTASWSYVYLADAVASGKLLTVSNSLTLTGTDATTMTFPTTSATIARTDAANTFTGVQTLSSAPVLSTATMTIGGDTVTIPTATDQLVARATTDTLTNKRITRRVLTTSGPGATPTYDTDNYDVVNLTTLATAITSMTTNATGTPVTGDQLIVRLTDNGTARAITWGANFEASTVALPTTTVISAMLAVGFLWNDATSKWRCVAVA